MSAERPLFTKEQITQAERRIGISHPVLSVIEHNFSTITRLNEENYRIPNSREQQKHTGENYGFLADALVEAGPYEMQPIDIVTIWSGAMEVFSRYHRYSLAAMVSGAYAIQGIENPEFRKLPRHFLETNKLPEGVIKDKSGLLHIQDRLDYVHQSLNDLDSYVYGTKEPGMQRVIKLAKMVRGGDHGAQEEIDKIIAHQKEHTTPVLGEIHENFGNGLSGLNLSIGDALGVK